MRALLMDASTARTWAERGAELAAAHAALLEAAEVAATPAEAEELNEKLYVVEREMWLLTIAAGDRVTIRTPHGNELTGRAVMLGPAGWVLNLGGRHGTPGIATVENLVKIVKPRRRA